MSGSLSVMQSLCVAQWRDAEYGGMLQSSGDAECVRPAHRTWLVMPFMHSETLADQEVCPVGYGGMLCILLYACVRHQPCSDHCKAC